MKITDTLKHEIKNIEKNQANSIPHLREDCTDIMICTRFADGKMHFLFPSKERIIEFVKELNAIILNDAWANVAGNYEKQKFEPLIDEKEFEV